jgi:transcriptional antiterminator NusG
MENWYSLHVMSGKEGKARDNLLARAIKGNLWQNLIFDILIPTEKEYITRRGKRVIADKKVFPGYIFVKMVLDDETEKIVHATDGVLGFVRSGSKPSPMPDHEIKAILQRLESVDETPKSHFKANEIVSIISGPFSDFSAKIDSVDETKGKLKAFVNVFGRDTIVEFDIKDVQSMA